MCTLCGRYKKRTYLKVKGEPERFRTFVDNLVADDVRLLLDTGYCKCRTATTAVLTAFVFVQLPLPLFVDTSHETHALGQFDYLNQVPRLHRDSNTSAPSIYLAIMQIDGLRWDFIGYAEHSLEHWEYVSARLQFTGSSFGSRVDCRIYC